jgi:alpha-beta hydrolase superfamily lysophospholipase
MIDLSNINYSEFDRREILMFLFYPRSEGLLSSQTDNVTEMLIPVEKDVSIGARFYHKDRKSPTILFFHGNGEIVADYSDIASLYSRMGINFLPVDYRGYGRSTGKPTVTGMMRDCHVIFQYVKDWLRENNHTGPFIAMGRSLGSASALELASHYKDQIDGLIIESGFALAVPLLRLLGIDTDAFGIREEAGFRNIDKIAKFDKPVLIIHAEYDHIIPYSDGTALYDHCPSQDKSFLKIPDADHNTIFLHGIKQYMQAVKELVEKLNNSS